MKTCLNCHEPVGAPHNPVCIFAYQPATQAHAFAHDGKADTGKAPWHLLPWSAVAGVVDVLAHGAAKYGERSWMAVPSGRDRYFAAAQRHLVAWFEGERVDAESGLPHLAHAACNVLFLAALEEKK